MIYKDKMKMTEQRIGMELSSLSENRRRITQPQYDLKKGYKLSTYKTRHRYHKLSRMRNRHTRLDEFLFGVLGPVNLVSRFRTRSRFSRGAVH